MEIIVQDGVKGRHGCRFFFCGTPEMPSCRSGCDRPMVVKVSNILFYSSDPCKCVILEDSKLFLQAFYPNMFAAPRFHEVTRLAVFFDASSIVRSRHADIHDP